MNRSLYIASSGMKAQQLNLDVIANNLANVNTTGFKKSTVDFQSLFYQILQRPVAAGENGINRLGIEVGTGVKVAATKTIFANGILEQTGNDLDLAIEGRGFFMVELPTGEVGFTRGGSLRVDGEGFLINPDGCRLLSTQGNVSAETPINIGGEELKYLQPDTDDMTINIAPNGEIITEKDIATPLILELGVWQYPFR